MNPEQIGLLAGLILTLMVFSYVLGDNFLYRIAVYIFVGLTAGYITIVTVESVILPWVRATILSGDVGGLGIGMIPFLIVTLLLLKTSPRLGKLGNLGMAFIVGIGASVAMVGAITGTLLPLVNATSNGVRTGDLLNGVVIFIGVMSSLMYFQYLARRTPDGRIRQGLVVRAVGGLGKIFLLVTFGALYAAAIISSLTVFSERVSFILARFMGS